LENAKKWNRVSGKQFPKCGRKPIIFREMLIEREVWVEVGILKLLRKTDNATSENILE
jgi:hypothetical protein